MEMIAFPFRVNSKKELRYPFLVTRVICGSHLLNYFIIRHKSYMEPTTTTYINTTGLYILYHRTVHIIPQYRTYYTTEQNILYHRTVHIILQDCTTGLYILYHRTVHIIPQDCTYIYIIPQDNAYCLIGDW